MPECLDFRIRILSEADAAAASALVHESFLQLAAKDWASEARQFLLTDSSPENLAGKL